MSLSPGDEILDLICVDSLALCFFLNLQVIYVEYSFIAEAKKISDAILTAGTKKQINPILPLNTFHNFCL